MICTEFGAALLPCLCSFNLPVLLLLPVPQLAGDSSLSLTPPHGSQSVMGSCPHPITPPCPIRALSGALQKSTPFSPLPSAQMVLAVSPMERLSMYHVAVATPPNATQPEGRGTGTRTTLSTGNSPVFEFPSNSPQTAPMGTWGAYSLSLGYALSPGLCRVYL